MVLNVLNPSFLGTYSEFRKSGKCVCVEIYFNILVKASTKAICCLTSEMGSIFTQILHLPDTSYPKESYILLASPSLAVRALWRTLVLIFSLNEL